MTSARIHAAIVVVAFGLVSHVHAESRGTFYLFQMDPGENTTEAGTESGWGLGAQVVFPLPSTREIVKLMAGLDVGNLESRVNDPNPAAGLFTNTVTSHDYKRIFGGVEFGRHMDARFSPHLSLCLALIRQDLQTFSLDTFSGLPGIRRSDSNSGLGYDIAAGLAFAVTGRFGLDLGVRKMGGFEITFPNADGTSTTVDPDYVQLYLGGTFRFGESRQP